MKRSATKEKILFTAIRLFAGEGYENVAMRDIAKAVGIKAASIYNHFPSKADILKSGYAFYVQQRRMAAPSLESLLRMAETEPVMDVLMQMDFRYPPELVDTLDHILVIGTHRASLDEDSRRFIREQFFDFPKSLLIPLLTRLIELGRIEPFDIDSLFNLLAYFAFSAAAFKLSEVAIDAEQWRRGLAIAFSVLKPIAP